MSSFREGVRGDLRCLMRTKNRRPLNIVATALTNRGFHAMLLYRLSHACWKRHIPVVPLVLTRLAQHLFAVDIAPQARLGPGIVIVHGFGTVIGNDVEIAGNCTLFHGVTLGRRGSSWVGSSHPDGQPKVGREVMFSAGAKVLGPLRIGDNCVVGANAVVLDDVPANSVVVGIPARVIGQRPTAIFEEV